jgi:Ulp1 family protease
MRRHIVDLKPGAWLHDEIINFYMDMLQDRDGKLFKDILVTIFKIYIFF